MLSEQSIKWLKLVTSMMYYSGAGPYRWIKTKDGRSRITLGGSLTYGVINILHFYNLLVYNFFLLVKLGYSLFSQNKASRTYTVQMTYNFLVYFMILCIEIQTYYRWDEMPLFINGYLTFFEKFKDRYLMKIHHDKKNGCETVFRTMSVLGFLITLQNTVLIIKAPYRSYFLTSLLDNPKLQSAPRLGLSLLQGWIWISCFAHCFFYGFIIFGYSYPGVFILKELSLANHRPPFTLMTTRQANNFMKSYRSFQVLSNMFNYTCQSWLLPTTHFFLINVVFVGIYGAVRVPGGRSIVMALAAGICLLYKTMMLYRMGRLDCKSEEVLKSWRKDGRRVVRKFVRSSLPIRARIGIFFVIDKTLVLLACETISIFAANMLITF